MDRQTVAGDEARRIAQHELVKGKLEEDVWAMNDRMPYVTSIVGFLAGGIAGAAAALLLAPQPGRATRETMARKMGETAGSARGMKDRALQKGGEIWGEAAHRVSDAASALSGGDGYKLGGMPTKSTSV